MSAGTRPVDEHGRQQRVRILDFIAAYVNEHGWAPTVREIASELRHQSPSSVHIHLRKLHDEGKLVLGGGPRMIRLTTGQITLRGDTDGRVTGTPPPLSDRVVSAIDAERRRR